MADPRYKVPDGYHIEHPNREKAGSKLTKLIVILLLLASVGLLVIVTMGGWDKLAGAKPVQISFIMIYALMALFVARWNRGVLPMAAALAMILGIFAGISAPEWFERSGGEGYISPDMPEEMLGNLTLLIVPVQVALIIFAMRGFAQAWNVEVEVPDGQHYKPGQHGAATA